MARKKKRAERRLQRVSDEAPAADDDASPTTESISCPFLDKLPAELRNRIYENLFFIGSCVQIRRTTRQDPPSRLSILQTCRKVNSEARNMFFAINPFLKFLTSADFVTFASGGRRVRHLVHTIFLQISAARDDDYKRVKKGRKWYKPWWETVAAMPALMNACVDMEGRRFIEQVESGQHVVNGIKEALKPRVGLYLADPRLSLPDIDDLSVESEDEE